jgi:trimethylamine--corrinoid protein Co-methyltransferase
MLDPQFAYQRLANALVPALAGVDILSGVGSTNNMMANSPVIAVIDNEIIGLIKHIVAGFQIDDEALAFDVMKTVIPRDGIFLAERHTLKQMRQDAIWIPGISEGAGDATRAGVLAKAKARTQEILQTHQGEPLPDDVSQHLDEIMEKASRKLLGS